MVILRDGGSITLLELTFYFICLYSLILFFLQFLYSFVQFVKCLLEPIINPETIGRHPSTELNEVCQKKNLKLQFIDLWQEFMRVDVLIDGELVGSGKCGSKKEIAHNRAAKNALENMEKKSRISISTKEDATEDVSSPSKCTGGPDASEDLSFLPKCNGGLDSSED